MHYEQLRMKGLEQNYFHTQVFLQHLSQDENKSTHEGLLHANLRTFLERVIISSILDLSYHIGERESSMTVESFGSENCKFLIVVKLKL